MTQLSQMPAVDEFTLTTIAQQSASIQAIAEQIMTLSGATARAMQAAKQAVDGVREMKTDLDAIRTQVDDVTREVRERIPLDPQQEGTLYQAVHARAAWAVKLFPDETYKTHIVRIWNKLKRDLVVSSYRRIPSKQYDYAMQAVLAYPGFGLSWKVK